MISSTKGAASAAPDIPQDFALKSQLALIAGNEASLYAEPGVDPPYWELRGLRDERIVARKFVPVCCPLRTIRYIREMAPHMDVYLGCAPRTNNTGGTLKDIVRVWSLWADCDSDGSAAKLRRFRPRPSLVIESSPGHFHGWWALSHPITPKAADRANRRLRIALSSDKTTDATRVLRPVGSINHKHGGLVRCVRLSLDAFSLADVVGGLADDERYKPRPRVPFQQRRRPHGAGGLVSTVAHAPQGNRNNALYWAARRASDDGLLEQVGEELVSAAVAAGLNERSAQATLLSAERSGAERSGAERI